MAAEGGHVSIVEFLIDRGAEIHVQDNTDVSISLLEVLHVFMHHLFKHDHCIAI